MKRNYTFEELNAKIQRDDRTVEIITVVLLALIVAGICWL